MILQPNPRWNAKAMSIVAKKKEIESRETFIFARQLLFRIRIGKEGKKQQVLVEEAKALRALRGCREKMVDEEEYISPRK